MKFPPAALAIALLAGIIQVSATRGHNRGARPDQDSTPVERALKAVAPGGKNGPKNQFECGCESGIQQYTLDSFYNPNSPGGYDSLPFFRSAANAINLGCGLAPFDAAVAEFGSVEALITAMETMIAPKLLPATFWVGADYTYFDTIQNELVPVPPGERQIKLANGQLNVCCLKNLCGTEENALKRRF